MKSTKRPPLQTTPLWKNDHIVPLDEPLIQEPDELLLALNNLRIEVLDSFDDMMLLSEIEETIHSQPAMVVTAFLDATIQGSVLWTQEKVHLLSWAIYDSLSTASVGKRRLLAEALGKLLALHKRDFTGAVRQYLSPENLLYNAEALEESFGSFVNAFVKHSAEKPMDEEELAGLLYFLQECGEKVWIDFCLNLKQEYWSPKLREQVLYHAREIDTIASIMLMEHLTEPGSLDADYLSYLDTPEDYLRNFAKKKVLEKIGIEMEWGDVFSRIPKNSTLYLNNLLDSTPPAAKIHTIEMLMQKNAEDEKKSYDLIVHLINILRNDIQPLVLDEAAFSLVQLSAMITDQQRRELIDELLRNISKENYPPVQMLGVLAHYLQQESGEEFIQWSSQFSKGIKSAQQSHSISLLRVIFELLRMEQEDPQREETLINLLLNGMGHFKDSTAAMGLWFLLGLLDDEEVTLEKKGRLLGLLLLKIHSILQSAQHRSLLYTVMRRYFLVTLFAFFEKNPPGEFFSLKSHPDIAFFPGTFDPFSAGHKAIAMEVAVMGYEVYLAIDEFSWSKATTAHLIRREIASLSIADEFHLHLFPSDYSINIANQKDLHELRRVFKDREITMLMGGDVILKASAYEKPRTRDSIHTFPHILFTRTDSQDVQKRADELRLDVKLLDLGFFSAISSTRIREGIGLQKDISGLVDPMAKEYIYEHDLYAVEERVKHSLRVQPRNTKIHDIVSENELKPFQDLFKGNLHLSETSSAPRVLELKMASGEHGFIAFHWIRLKELHREITEPFFYHHVSENAIGRLLCIDAIYTEGDSVFLRRLLQELFRFVLPKDYTYCIYQEENAGEYEEILSSMGFLYLDSGNKRLYYVDMSHPCTLTLDVEELILEPYASTPSVRLALNEARASLRSAITSVFPGQLLLSIDQVDMYDTLIPLITTENQVPSVPLRPRKLGEALCVPFGEIFKKRTLPNTVTKSMHTEKIFAPDLNTFRIEHFPGYLNLQEQVQMVRSFDRPILLVDDLLHKGYRLLTLLPILKEYGMGIQKLFVGILSGIGKSIADENDLEVESAYFIPRLRMWFQESKLYPYIGGDSVSGELPASKAGSIPSVNLVYPYAKVDFMEGENPEAMMQFSDICLRSSLQVLRALEEEYLHHRQRLLSMDRLTEVLRYTRFPVGRQEEVGRNRRPSELLERDLLLLRRLKGSSI